jgi:hypothetical protein
MTRNCGQLWWSMRSFKIEKGLRATDPKPCLTCWNIVEWS